MNPLSYASWIAGPALQVTLLTFMVRRGSHTVFPRFFYYIVFQLLKTLVLFVTYRFFDESYFDIYWAGNAISVLLAVTVMDEVLHHLFRRYGGIQTLGSTIFRWSCGLLLVLAIVTAISSQEGSADRVVAAVLAFERSVRLVQVGLFFLLMVLCRFLKNCWRQQVFGIALGFGVFASIELILVSTVIWHGNVPEETVSLVKSLAYNGVTLLWIGYLMQQRDYEPVPVLGTGPQLDGLRLVLVSPAVQEAVQENDESFIAMVEQAVDRVLSRSPWPRPTTQGSEIVGRAPKPEESN